MPLSSKRIVEYIASMNGKIFTRQDLSGISTAGTGHRKKKKSGKASAGSDAKNRAKTDSVFLALLSAGFIKQEGPGFTPALSVKGTVSMKGREPELVCDAPVTVFLTENLRKPVIDGDQVLAQIVFCKKDRFYAEVTGILERKRRILSGKYLRTAETGLIYQLTETETEVLVKRTGDRTSEKHLSRKDCLYALELQGMEMSGKRPVCRIRQILPYNDESSDLSRICLKYSLPEQYSENCLDQRELTSAARAAKKQRRKDYTKDTAVTIDGADAKDFDDAVSAKQEGDCIRLYVHIADVSEYVKKDSPLDREAFARSTSFYLGDTVIPMLPEILCNDLCSLREGKDRLTLSVEMLYSPDGTLLEKEFHTGIINVSCRLTYEEAEAMISGGRKTKVSSMLRLLDSLTQVLYERRLGEGKLDLDIPDAVPVYENGAVRELIYAPRLKSHRLIEECMLSANQAVACLLREKQIPAIFRVHEKTDGEKIFSIIKFIRSMGIKIKQSGDPGETIQRIIKAVKGQACSRAVNMAVLKTMAQACYDTVPLGHFGLGFADYTHFTSPIRRYPDLAVHRCLKSFLAGTGHLYENEELAAKAGHTSEMERTAQKAERDLLKLKTCRLLSGREGEKFAAYVSGVSRYGFYVTLKDSPMEGMVPLRLMTDDYYLIQEDEYTVTGKRFSRRYRLGDEIRVRLVSADLENMRIDFEPV